MLLLIKSHSNLLIVRQGLALLHKMVPLLFHHKRAIGRLPDSRIKWCLKSSCFAFSPGMIYPGRVTLVFPVNKDFVALETPHLQCHLSPSVQAISKSDSVHALSFFYTHPVGKNINGIMIESGLCQLLGFHLQLLRPIFEAGKTVADFAQLGRILVINLLSFILPGSPL